MSSIVSSDMLDTAPAAAPAAAPAVAIKSHQSVEPLLEEDQNRFVLFPGKRWYRDGESGPAFYVGGSIGRGPRILRISNRDGKYSFTNV